jgi:hypothetical protein
MTKKAIRARPEESSSINMSKLRFVMTRPDEDGHISDTTLYDEIGMGPSRLRELFRAIGTMPGIGPVTEEELIPIAGLGADEAERVIEIFDQWNEQKKEKAV